MKDEDWMDAGAACALLAVRRQTLYAYVSRGLIHASSDPEDPRRSLYLARDVTALAAKHRRPRARADVAAGAIRWGDPVLDTAVSEVRDGTLYFGAQRAVDLAAQMTLEEVAAHHWRADPPWPGHSEPPGSGDSALARGLLQLARTAASAAPMQSRGRAALAAEGARCLAALSDAMLGHSGAAGEPIHQQIARLWNLNAHAGDLVRQAFVLLSDHDLNPSSFAVRVCASTGASLPASLLAGLATLSGPRHGGVATRAREAVEAGASARGIAAFLDRQQGETPYSYGFGHPLYPGGDARAAHLLSALGEGREAVSRVRRFSKALGVPPNIDAALAAMALELQLPEEAPLVIFSLGRAVGWIAHAMEQVETGQIIRPRARFVGAGAVA